jgi:hypothetical protein
MNGYYVEITFEMGRQDDRQGFEEHLDDVAEAFAAVADVDGDVGVDLATGRVDLCMTLSAKDRTEALVKAVGAARTAVHPAGGATPGWERMLSQLIDRDEYSSSVTPSAWAGREDCTA